jgi:hypothetical protein
MEGAAGEASPAVASGSPAGAGRQLVRRGSELLERVGRPAAPEPAGASDAEEDEVGGGDDDPADEGDVFRGRPDLAQDTIETLRRQHRELKAQQKKVRRQLKNQAKKRSRIVKKMRHLDTAAVLQVLMERGVDFTGQAVGGAPAADAAARPAAEAAGSGARGSRG